MSTQPKRRIRRSDGALVLDLTGQRFGLAIAVSVSVAKDGRTAWRCVCDCGAVFETRAQSLKSGGTKSCGAATHKRVFCAGVNATHGRSKTRTHAIWVGLRRRCLNPSDAAFPRYGGRGIAVCGRWESFENFLSDMGEAPDGMEIERINVDGNYEPSNCRWATLIEQANNKRNNRMVPHNGQLLTVAEYARALGLKYSTAYARAVVRDGAPHRSEITNPAPTLDWEN